MSKISEYSTLVNTQFDTISSAVDEIVVSQDGIAQDIAFLKALILELQNSPGAITPEDQAILDSLVARITGLVTKTTAVSEALKALDASTESVPPAPVG